MMSIYPKSKNGSFEALYRIDVADAIGTAIRQVQQRYRRYGVSQSALREQTQLCIRAYLAVFAKHEGATEPKDRR